MALPSPEIVVQRFLDAVNAHDVAALLDVLSPTHAFTDSLGNTLVGIDAIERAWRGYFALFPDYHVEVDDVVCEGRVVAIFGIASGTYAQAATEVVAAWRVNAAWRAVVVDGLLSEWQVYADNKRVYEILAQDSGRTGSGPR